MSCWVFEHSNILGKERVDGDIVACSWWRSEGGRAGVGESGGLLGGAGMALSGGF